MYALENIIENVTSAMWYYQSPALSRIVVERPVYNADRKKHNVDDNLKYTLTLISFQQNIIDWLCRQ